MTRRPQWLVRRLFRPLLERVRKLDDELATVNLGHLACATTTLDSPPTMPLAAAQPQPAVSAPAPGGAFGSSFGSGFGFGGGSAFGPTIQRVPTSLQEWQQLGSQVTTWTFNRAERGRSTNQTETLPDVRPCPPSDLRRLQPALLVQRLRLETYLNVGRPAAPRDYVLGRLAGPSQRCVHRVSAPGLKPRRVPSDGAAGPIFPQYALRAAVAPVSPTWRSSPALQNLPTTAASSATSGTAAVSTKENRGPKTTRPMRRCEGSALSLPDSNDRPQAPNACASLPAASRRARSTVASHWRPVDFSLVRLLPGRASDRTGGRRGGWRRTRRQQMARVYVALLPRGRQAHRYGRHARCSALADRFAPSARNGTALERPNRRGLTGTPSAGTGASVAANVQTLPATC